MYIYPLLVQRHFGAKLVINDFAGMVMHRLNLSNPVLPVQISVYPANNETLHLYIDYDQDPTPEDYALDIVIPRNLTEGSICFLVSRDNVLLILVQVTLGQS